MGENPVMQVAEFASKILPQSLKTAIYHLPIISKPIRSFLNQFVLDGITKVKVASGPLQGTWLHLNLRSEKYYWLGNYEPFLVQAISDFVKPGMIVYDVGANIGYMSLIFGKATGAHGKVYTFEPMPDNVSRINVNVTINKLSEIIIIVPAAVSNQAGTDIFLVHKNLSMGKLVGSGGRDESYESKVEVPTITLDDFVLSDGNPCPHLIKIDVEGGGAKVLNGMSTILSKYHPRIFMEIHGQEERDAAASVLGKNGYEIRRMTVDYPLINLDHAKDFKDYIVALPNS